MSWVRMESSLTTRLVGEANRRRSSRACYNAKKNFFFLIVQCKHITLYNCVDIWFFRRLEKLQEYKKEASCKIYLSQADLDTNKRVNKSVKNDLIKKWTLNFKKNELQNFAEWKINHIMIYYKWANYLRIVITDFSCIISILILK